MFIRKIGINGNILKSIAVISMLVDHCIKTGVMESSVVAEAVGRMAFPIFAFLSAEGILHTSNKKKYLFTLLLFAVLSEIAFDLCFFNTIFYPLGQNVIFTIFIGAVAAYAAEKVKLGPITDFVISFAVFALSLVFAVDYIFFGALFIYWLGRLNIIFSNHKGNASRLRYFKLFSILLLIAVTITMICFGQPVSQACALLDVPLFLLYNGEKCSITNKRLMRVWKYFFYVFYPFHMFILYFLQKI